MLRHKLFSSTCRMALVLSGLLLMSCVATRPGSSSSGSGGPELDTLESSAASFGEHGKRISATRTTASIESGAGLLGKTLVLDPLVRPFSTAKALYGLTVKSTGGFIERTFIEQLRFPLLEGKPVPGVSHAPPMNIESWERELDDLTSTPPTRGTIRFLIDGDAYFNRLVHSIAQADESIDIRSYIFDNDDVTLEIADLLRRKSDSVETRVLVDGLADLFATRRDSTTMPVSTRLPASISDYLSYGSKVEFRKQSNPWLTGDHVKVTIIDRERAFLGGMNIGREYRYDWHDLMMEVEGPVVRQLQFEFDQSWAKAGWLGDLGWLIVSLGGYQPDTSERGYPIRVLSTRIHNSEIYRAQVAAIRRARSHIYIENAYFSDDKILFELARARRRGVDVRVILTAQGDSGVLNLSNQKTINRMLNNGIRVYLYPGMTHVKAAVYDGWACLGSANFDKLSLQINQEINLGFSDAATIENLVQQVFYPDFAISTELSDPLPLTGRHHFAEMIADELY